MISMIAVIGKNRGLGKDNHLLWNIPSDLKRFREITKGHPVIMGRNTFVSIGHPLPNRVNIVVTRDPDYHHAGVTVASSIDDAIRKAHGAEGSEEIFIIGGAQIYAAGIPKADRLYMTVVDDIPVADVFFPDYSEFKKIVSTENHEENGLHFTYLTLEK